MCTKDVGKELKESDIQYRYRGLSERIKYPEIRAIHEAKRETEQRLWMQHLENIARIGVREAGVFDLHTGSVTGSGGSFLIDESLLSQLSFIKGGEFSEVKGKSALKLIGHVEPLAGSVIGTAKKQIVKTKGIRTADIVLSSLNQDNVPEPDAYFKQICLESAAFLTIYYFMKSGMTLDKSVEVLEGMVSRSAARGLPNPRKWEKWDCKRPNGNKTPFPTAQRGRGSPEEPRVGAIQVKNSQANVLEPITAGTHSVGGA